LKIIGPEVMACNLPLRLDPYLSCEHNCTYCYARGQLHRFGAWKPDSVKSMDPTQLEIKLKRVFSHTEPPLNPLARALWHRFPIRIGTNTDPFQPIEAKLRITEAVMKILNKFRYPYIINTKSNMIAEERYLTLLKNSPAGAIVQFTVISLDHDLTAKIEPKAPSVPERIHAMKKVADKGIYVQNRVSPIIPEVTEDLGDMKLLFERLKAAGTKDIIVEYLRYNPFIRQWMASALLTPARNLDEIYLRAYHDCNSSFPECCERNKRRFGCGWNCRPKMISGYIRMPLRLKLERYKSFKDEALKQGLRFFVCSEEFPEINECVNCCGIAEEEARKYLTFQVDNSACANTIPCLVKKKKEIGIKDVLESRWTIHADVFKKQFQSLDKYLVNVRRVGPGRFTYDENFPV